MLTCLMVVPDVRVCALLRPLKQILWCWTPSHLPTCCCYLRNGTAREIVAFNRTANEISKLKTLKVGDVNKAKAVRIRTANPSMTAEKPAELLCGATMLRGVQKFVCNDRKEQSQQHYLTPQRTMPRNAFHRS